MVVCYGYHNYLFPLNNINLLNLVRRSVYRSGQMVYQAGDLTEEVYFVISGTVEGTLEGGREGGREGEVEGGVEGGREGEVEGGGTAEERGGGEENGGALGGMAVGGGAGDCGSDGDSDDDCGGAVRVIVTGDGEEVDEGEEEEGGKSNGSKDASGGGDGRVRDEGVRSLSSHQRTQQRMKRIQQRILLHSGAHFGWTPVTDQKPTRWSFRAVDLRTEGTR